MAVFWQLCISFTFEITHAAHSPANFVNWIEYRVWPCHHFCSSPHTTTPPLLTTIADRPPPPPLPAHHCPHRHALHSLLLKAVGGSKDDFKKEGASVDYAKTKAKAGGVDTHAKGE